MCDKQIAHILQLLKQKVCGISVKNKKKSIMERAASCPQKNLSKVLDKKEVKCTLSKGKSPPTDWEINWVHSLCVRAINTSDCIHTVCMRNIKSAYISPVVVIIPQGCRMDIIEYQ